jgi:hypothetical protein
MYGNLFKFTIRIGQTVYEGLIYLDTTSVVLLKWSTKLSGKGCEIESTDFLLCLKCEKGFILTNDKKSCVREI